MKLPAWPSDFIIRWQGIIGGIGFFDRAVPVARAAFGWFAKAASWL